MLDRQSQKHGSGASRRAGGPVSRGYRVERHEIVEEIEERKELQWDYPTQGVIYANLLIFSAGAAALDALQGM